MSDGEMKYFQIQQVSAGWIEGVITDKLNSIAFSASYIKDFPTDLMNAMLYALGCLPEDEGNHQHARTCWISN